MEDERFQITPRPHQTEFVTSQAKFTCLSGGWGNGKTTALCLRALLLSSMPNNFGLIGRMTYPELRDTTRRTFFELCPPEYYDSSGGGEWRISENHLRLINGSEIIFRHLDQVSEKELLSLNLGWFAIDQAEEISEQVYNILISRLRLGTIPNRYGFIACNPEPGNWIYRKFKQPKEEKKLAPDHELVEASTFDNKENLPDDYIPTLIANMPEEMQRRYIQGEWEFFEGAIFKEWNRSIHVIKPFDIPKSWEKLISIDHGMQNPTAVLWGAVDFDNNLFITDEYYQPGVVSEHAKTILEKTGDQEISFWIIDPSTVNKTREKEGMPWSVIEEYEDHGIWAYPGNDQKLAGINRVREFMKVDPTRRNPITGLVGSPRLFVFSNCVNLITEIPQYQWKKMRSMTPRNAPELPRDYEDHAIDACRYMIMSRFPAPVRRPVGDEIISPFARRNTNLMTKTLPQNQQGDELLGQFADGGSLIHGGEEF